MRVRTTNLVGWGTWNFILLRFLFGSVRAENAPVLLWPNGAPGSEGKAAEETVRVNENGEDIVSSVHRPSITPYLPSKDKATGAAVIIAPGVGTVNYGWITKATTSLGG